MVVFLRSCGGVLVVVFLRSCGGVCVMVFCVLVVVFSGGVCVVVFLWCSCGGVFVVVFLRSCGGVCVVVFCVLVVVFLWWCLFGGVFVVVFLWWCLNQANTLFESSEQRFNMVQSIKVVTNHSIGTCSVDLYILYPF